MLNPESSQSNEEYEEKVPNKNRKAVTSVIYTATLHLGSQHISQEPLRLKYHVGSEPRLIFGLQEQQQQEMLLLEHVNLATISNSVSTVPLAVLLLTLKSVP